MKVESYMLNKQKCLENFFVENGGRVSKPSRENLKSSAKRN